MIVATFNASTGWAGRRIHYDAGQFTLDDFGPVTREALLDYDGKGQLDWAYGGLREWVQAETQQPATTMPTAAVGVDAAAQAPKQRRKWPWIVVGVVVVIVVLSMVVEWIITPSVPAPLPAPPVPTATAAARTAAPSVAPTPALVIGKPVTIAGNGQQVTLTVTKVFKTRWVPFLGKYSSSHIGARLAGGWTWLVAKLRFKNTGTKYYHSVVPNWTTVRVSGSDKSEVDASGVDYDMEYVDLQGKPGSNPDSTTGAGQLQLDAGKSATWFVAFRVRRVAHPVSLSYRGPGGKSVTVSLSR